MSGKSLAQNTCTISPSMILPLALTNNLKPHIYMHSHHHLHLNVHLRLCFYALADSPSSCVLNFVFILTPTATPTNHQQPHFYTWSTSTSPCVVRCTESVPRVQAAFHTLTKENSSSGRKDSAVEMAPADKESSSSLEATSHSEIGGLFQCKVLQEMVLSILSLSPRLKTG